MNKKYVFLVLLLLVFSTGCKKDNEKVENTENNITTKVVENVTQKTTIEIDTIKSTTKIENTSKKKTTTSKTTMGNNSINQTTTKSKNTTDINKNTTTTKITTTNIANNKKYTYTYSVGSTNISFKFYENGKLITSFLTVYQNDKPIYGGYGDNLVIPRSRLDLSQLQNLTISFNGSSTKYNTAGTEVTTTKKQYRIYTETEFKKFVSDIKDYANSKGLVEINSNPKGNLCVVTHFAASDLMSDSEPLEEKYADAKSKLDNVVSALTAGEVGQYIVKTSTGYGGPFGDQLRSYTLNVYCYREKN